MKKFLSFVLVLVLSFFLFGCDLLNGGGGGGVVVPTEVDFDDVFINVSSQIENKDNITDNITLPTKFGVVTIQWTSMNENVISSSGVVTRPDEDTRVVLKCDLYANGEHRQYEVNIVVKAKEVIITPVEVSSIRNIKAGEVGNKYKTQATVVALAKVGAVIQDNTGLIYCYFGSLGTDSLAIGDVIEVEGNTSLYGGAVQFSDGSTYKKVSTATVDQASADLMSATDFAALKDAASEIRFVKFEGTLTKSGNYYNITLEGLDTNLQGSLCTPSADLSEFAGKKVEVSGYFVYTITASSGVTYNYVAYTDIKLSEGQENPPTPVTYNTFAEVKASEVGKEYNVKDALVIGLTSTGFLTKDSSGYMFIYVGSGYVADVVLGDVLTIKGTSSSHGGAIQLGSATYEKTGTQTVTHPNPRVLDKASYEALNASTVNIEYVQLEATLRLSGSYYNLEVKDSTLLGSILAPSNNNYAEMAGKVVVVTGYFVYISGSSTKYISIIPTEVKLSENQGSTEIETSTIQEVIAATVGKTYKVRGQVVAVSSQSVLIKDDTGMIYCYFSTDFKKDLAIGDVIDAQGTTQAYGGLVQFNRPEYTKVETKEVIAGEATELDKDAYNAIVASTDLSVQYVTLVAKIKVSGNYTNFIIDGGTIAGSIVYPVESLEALNEKNATITGYFIGITGSSTKYFSILATSVVEKEDGGQGQENPPTPLTLSTIAEVKALAVGTECLVKGTVVATSNNSVLIQDSTGLILVYCADTYTKDLKITDEIEVTGKVASYGGQIQISEPTYKKTGYNEVTYPTARVLDKDAYEALLGADAVVEYVTLTAKLSIEGVYTNLVIDGSELTGSLVSPDQDLSGYNGKYVEINAYFVYVAGSTKKYVYFMATSVAEKQMSNAEKLAEIKENVMAVNNMHTVRSLMFFTEYDEFTVAWVSNNPNIMTNEGVLTIPEVTTPVDFAVTITDGTVTEVVTITIYADAYSNISDITQATELDLDKMYAVKATVVATANQAFLIQQGDDYIYVYNKNYAKDLVVGDEVKVSGYVSVYNGIMEFSDFVGYQKTGNTNTVNPTYQALTNDEMIALVRTPVTTPVKLEGTLIKSGNYINLRFTDSSITGSIITNDMDVTELLDKEVVVEGYFIYASGNGAYFNVMATSITEKEGGEVTPPTPLELSTIASVKAGEVGKEYKVSGTVVASGTTSILIQDDTGLILLYFTNGSTKAYAVGEIVTVEAKLAAYGGQLQLAEPTSCEVTGEKIVTQPEPRVLDKDAYEALLGADAIIEYVKLQAKLVISGQYYNLEVEGSDISGAIVPPLADVSALNGKTIDLLGYFVYVTGSSKKYIYFIATDIVEVEGQDNPLTPLELSTIASVKAGELNQKYLVQGTIMAVSNSSILIQDSTGIILVYFANGFNKDVLIGDVVEVEAKLTTYGGTVQLVDATYEKKDEAVVTYPEPRVLDKDAYEALNGETIQIEYVQLQAKLIVSGKYYNLEVEGSDLAGSIVAPLENISSFDGKQVEIKGYFVYVSGSDKKYVSFIITSILEVEGQDNPPTPLELSTIAQVKAGEVGQEYKASGTVVALGNNAFLVQDETGLILAYFGNDSLSGVAVGDVVTVEGATSLYGGSVQFNLPTFTVTGQGTVTYPSPRLLDQEAYEALFGEYVNIEYVQLTAALSISGKYFNITVGDSTMKASLVAPMDDISALNGKNINFTGYTVYITGTSTKYLYFFATSIEEIKASDEELLAEIKASILELNNLKTVNSLVLTNEIEGFTITWVSSNEEVMTSSGVVTIQESEEVTVPFTVTISNGTLTETVRISFIVGTFTRISEVLQKQGEELDIIYAVKGTVVASADLGFVVYDDAYIWVYYGDTYAKDLQVGDDVIVRGYLYPYQGINEYHKFIGYTKQDTTSEVIPTFTKVDQTLVNTLSNNPVVFMLIKKHPGFQFYSY